MAQRFEVFVDGARVLRTEDKEMFEQKKKELTEANVKFEVNVKTLYQEVNDHSDGKVID